MVLASDKMVEQSDKLKNLTEDAFLETQSNDVVNTKEIKMTSKILYIIIIYYLDFFKINGQTKELIGIFSFNILKKKKECTISPRYLY